MKDRPLKNTAASVRQRLLNLARERGDDFNLLLSRYVHERLLYRLERSPEAEHFIVKGATLFALWSAMPHRATRDVDLLGYGTPDISRLEVVFRGLCSIVVEPDDGVTFDASSVRAQAIREHALYDGIRVEMEARLDPHAFVCKWMSASAMRSCPLPSCRRSPRCSISLRRGCGRTRAKP